MTETNAERLKEIESNVRQQSLLKEDGLEHQVIVRLDDYVYLHEQAERVQELESELKGDGVLNLKEQLNHAKEEVQRLQGCLLEGNQIVREFAERERNHTEALEFYADEYNYSHDPECPILKEYGKKARKALEGMDL